MSTRAGRLGILVPGIMLLMTAGLPGEPPARFNYQARLTDGQGAPLKGDHTLHLTLYHGGTAGSPDSGVAVFAETALVTAVDGGVSHAVGTGTNTLGGALAASMLDFAGDIFLQVGVDTAGNVVLPRTRLDSVPFALNVPAGGGAVPQGGIIAAEPTATLPGFTPLGMRLDSPGKWVVRQEMPTTRTGAFAAEVNGRIYVIGGAEFLAVFATNDEYDPATDTWATRSPMPNPRQGAAGAVVGGKIYVFGGSGTFQSLGTVSSSVYDPATDDWDPIQDLPAPRMAAVAVAVGSRVYVMGGIDASGVFQNTTLVYNTGTNIWDPAKSTFPDPRYLATGGLVNGQLIIAGGLGASSSLQSAYQYNESANQWLSIRPLPDAAYAIGGAVVADTLFVLGGGGPDGIRRTVYGYDATSDSWLAKAILPEARYNGATAAYGGHVYYFGGGTADATVANDTWEMDPAVFSLHKKD
jgi:N-acetylneuraminic acid mutarotase